MKSAALACLLCLGAGLAAGVWLERRRGAAAAESAARANEAAKGASQEKASTNAEDAAGDASELGKANAKIAELKTEVAKLGGAPADGAKTGAQTAEELRAKIPELVEKKDGAGLIDLMKELAALGPDGFAGAMEVAEIFRKEFGNGDQAFGLSKVQFNKAFNGPMVGLMTWAIQNPADASPWFRAKSVHMLYWVSDVDATPILLAAIGGEKDPGVAQAMAGYLASLAKPEMTGAIEEAIRSHEKRSQEFQPLVDALVKLHTPESGAALEDLKRGATPALAASIELALVEHSPPAEGVMITWMRPKSQADSMGLQKGDIIMSYDERPVPSLDALRKAVQAKPDNDLVTVMVNRHGTLVPVTMKGSEIGVDGKFVKPQ